jgi:hypothetical protein
MPLKGWPYVNSPFDDSPIKKVTAEEGTITF